MENSDWRAMRGFPFVLLLAILGNVALGEDGDLFTGVPKDEFEKRAEKFQASRWNAVVQASDAEPFEIPKSNGSALQASQAYAAWLKAKLTDPALEEIKGDPKEEKLRALGQAAGLWLSGLPQNLVALGPLAIEIHKAKVRRPHFDYLVARVLDSVDKETQSLSLYAAIVEAKEVPMFLRVASQARIFRDALWTHPKQIPAARERYLQILEEHTQTPVAEEDAVYVMRWYELFPISFKAAHDLHDRYLELFTKANWPEWLKLTFVGYTEIDLAWLARGGDWRPKPGGADPFANHLAKARTALTRAWELKPSSPWAAEGMLKVVMGGGGAKDDTLRKWLNRAIAHEIDRASAFEAFFQASRPRWGGSYEEMLAVGRACALSGRFETDLPTVFNQAVLEIARDSEDGLSLFRHQDIARLLLETRKKRLEKAAGTGAESRQRAYLFFESCLVGDLDGTTALLPQVRGWKEGFHTMLIGVASRIGMDYCQMLAEAECAASPVRKEWEKAASLASQGEHGQAAELLKSVAGKTEGLPSQAPIAALIRLYQFRADFEKGGWVKLPFEGSDNWRLLNGTHEMKEARLRLTTPIYFGRQLHRAELGTRFEVRGKFQASKRPRRGGVAFYFGHSPAGTGSGMTDWWLVRVDNIEDTKNSADFNSGWASHPAPMRVDIPWKAEAEFLLRRDKEEVTFTVDGNRIFTKELPRDLPGEAEAFGIGAISQGKGAYGEFWDLEVRKLAAE